MWPMVTGACVAIGFIHMRMGLRSKSGTAHLLFALTALADLVISNDSGPAHLGGLLNIPTVAILGVTSGAVFAHLRSVYILRQNQLGCSGCHYGKPYRPACRIGCQELFRTHPETVLDFATGILAGPVELPVETPSTTPIPRRKKK